MVRAGVDLRRKEEASSGWPVLQPWIYEYN
jgi:hypothetical protein